MAFLTSLSDSALSIFRAWVGWAAVGGSAVGVVCAVLNMLSAAELASRSKAKSDAAAASLIETKAELSAARDLADKAHLATLPRVMGDDQRLKLTALLSAVPKGRVVVKANLFDGEAEAFATQIRSVLSSTGQDMTDFGGCGLVSLHKSGGAIIVMKGATPPAHTGPIAACFTAVGLDFPATTYDDAKFPEDAIIVWVSHK